MHANVTGALTTFQRLGIQVDLTVTNFVEGFCFRYGIPKHEQQVVIHFGGLLSHDNFEAISSWIHGQICESDATDIKSLISEVECRFDAKLDELY